MQSVAAIVVAAGRGERAGQSKEGPKQYRRIAGKAILARTVEALKSHGAVGEIVVVIHEDDRDLASAALATSRSAVRFVTGGATRQESVLNGLRALAASSPAIVLIQDAVRPFLHEAVIDRVLAAIDDQTGAIAAIPVSDTLKSGDPAAGIISGTVDRSSLYAAQTPQGFPFAAIVSAHEEAARSGRMDFTDDASIAEASGLAVRLVAGDAGNIKITYAEDIAMAESRLAAAAPLPDVRVGNGYDVHSFEPGDAVYLCGVRIPHDRRLSGHSDADVGLHALTDALLATCSAGDIGTHFPPSDPQWKGAASRRFVEHAVSLVRAQGGRIANADVTLICEEPRIGPNRDAMVAEMASMLGIDSSRVSVKATTNEKLGFIGRGEGIAAIATASVVFPGGLE